MFFSKEEPSKGKLIGYWIVTVVAAGMMLMSGSMALMKNPEVVKVYTGLGYPEYFMVLLGTAKVLGGITLLIPGLPRLKEWAYAGIAITLVSATVSHAAAGDPVGKIVPPVVIFVVLLASYFLRPPSRVIQ